MLRVALVLVAFVRTAARTPRGDEAAALQALDAALDELELEVDRQQSPAALALERRASLQDEPLFKRFAVEGGLRVDTGKRKRFLAPVRNDPISPEELTFRAVVREEVGGQVRRPLGRGMHDIVVKASDAPGGTVQLFGKQRLRGGDAAPLWTWTPGESVPALTTDYFTPEEVSRLPKRYAHLVNFRGVSLSFTKSVSSGSKRVNVMTFSAPGEKVKDKQVKDKVKDTQAGPLGLTLLSNLLNGLHKGVLPAEPSYHLGYLIRLEEFRDAGAGVTGCKKKLPSRPNALQPLLGVEKGKKIAAGSEGQVLLAAPQQRAWDNLEAGPHGAKYAVVVDGRGLYGSDLHRAPPIIFKESYVTQIGGGFEYTEVEHSLKLMAHEFAGRTAPAGAAHIVRMYGRLVNTDSVNMEGVVLEQMTGTLEVLIKALPEYSSAVDTAVRGEAARWHDLKANHHPVGVLAPDVAELQLKIHRRRLGVVRIAMQTLSGLRQAAPAAPTAAPALRGCV